MIKLVPIKEIQASEYNPRRNDEKRLALTELSLKSWDFFSRYMRIPAGRYYPGTSVVL